MGWIKSIAHETEAIAEYWEVVSIFYDHKAQTSNLAVCGWVSKAAYNANSPALISRNWNIPSGSAPKLAEGAVAFITAFARSQPEFHGSEDE